MPRVVEPNFFAKDQSLDFKITDSDSSKNKSSKQNEHLKYKNVISIEPHSPSK